MTDEVSPEAPVPDDLQFDHAEFESPQATAVTCVACKQVIPESYFEVNGKIVCGRCRQAIEARLTGGSGARRFVRAFVFGTVAGFLGWALYFAVAKITHYELALISILVGWMVGSAVAKGSDHRGGWLYQLLAIWLTYTAVVAIYIPDIVTALNKQFGKDKVAVQVEKPGAPGAADGRAADPVKPKRPPVNPALKVVGYLLISFVVVVFAYAVPFLAGFKNLIGLLIIFFALQQAWRMNRRPKLVFNGPYQVGDEGGEALQGAPSHA